MDAGFNVAARQCCQRIAGVDGDGSILRLDPFPVALGVEDLECGYRLAEEQSHATKIGVAGTVKLSHFLVLFRSTRGVVHITEMILAAVIVKVILDELFFIGQLKQQSEEAQQLHHDLRVTLAAKLFNLLDVGLQHIGLCTLVEAIEFRKVVHLDVVDNTRRKALRFISIYAAVDVDKYSRAKTSRSVSIVITTLEGFDVVVL